MYAVEVGFKGTSPLSFSRDHRSDKLNAKESHDAYEQRTWREKLHYDSTGEIYVPQMMIKFCISAAAQYSSTKIKGKGQATYTKHFTSGMLVNSPIMLGIHKDDVPGETFSCHANGKRGPGSRVPRTFPMIYSWSGETAITILDEELNFDIVLETLRNAGMFIGFGRFRPQMGGLNGRFEITRMDKAEIV